MKNSVIPCLKILSVLVLIVAAPSKAQDSEPRIYPPARTSKVAFASATDVTKRVDIFEVNPDGSGLRLITSNPKDYWRWNCCPSWSPNGNELAFVSQDLPTFRASHAAILLWESAGGSIRTLYRDDSMCPQDPAWSPDGKHIVFTRGSKSREPKGRLGEYRTEVCTEQQLFSINADGSGLRQLTNNETNSSTRPAWSPDGSMIAYSSGRNSNHTRKAEIYLIDNDGSGARQLTYGGPREVNIDPSWSPDGTKIAFSSNRGGSFEVYVMNRDGTDAHQIISGVPRGAHHPSWSPDGRNIVFGVAPAMSVYIMNADGMNRRVLVQVGWHPVFGEVAVP